MKRGWLAFSLVLLSACNLAPKYSSPEIALPSEFRLEIGPQEEEQNVAWWKAWGDEVLDEYIQTALEHNKDLKVAMWTVSEYLAQYQVARSSLFPQFSLNSLAVKESLPIDEDFLPQGFSPITPDYRLNMSVSYELDFWGKLRNQSSAAYSEYLAEVENRKIVVLTLVGSVAEAYVTLRQLDAQLEVSRSILKSREEAFDIATYRFEGGLTSKIEVDQSLSAYQESIATVENLEKLVPQQENLLCVLLGQAPQKLKRGKKLSELQLPSVLPVGQPQDLLTRRPDIVQAENLLKAAYANVGVARAAFFPQISFAALFGYDSLQLKTLLNKKSQTWSLGGSLLQEVFTGGALTGQLKISKAQKEELVFSYEQTILTALQEVNDALVGLEQSKEIFLADSVQVGALRDYLKLAWERYYEGQTQYLTVLDAEREEFNAELNMIAAEAQPFLFLINLYKALGGGWIAEADHQAMEYGVKP